jgi:DNA-binding NarL/FixJ family response regulator
VQVAGVCTDPALAFKMVQEIRPTLVLSAIFFDGEPYGIELSRLIQDDLGVPVIFVGESEDPLLLLQISMTQPAGYVTDARDRGYIEAVLSRALKGARSTVAGPY